jgi:hypothetical protein
MTTSTGIEKKKELLSSEERRGDARKEHDAGKILQEQATAETFPRKPSTNHGKKRRCNQKRKKTDASHSKRVGKWRGQEFAPRRKNEGK